MPSKEYVLSLCLALAFMGGLVLLTQSLSLHPKVATPCEHGRVTPPVVLKGMSLHPPCLAGKRT